MRRIVFDCERMKYPDTGLYHYCLNLGKHLEKNMETPGKEHQPAGGKPIFLHSSL